MTLHATLNFNLHEEEGESKQHDAQTLLTVAPRGSHLHFVVVLRIHHLPRGTSSLPPRGGRTRSVDPFSYTLLSCSYTRGRH